MSACLLVAVGEVKGGEVKESGLGMTMKTPFLHRIFWRAKAARRASSFCYEILASGVRTGLSLPGSNAYK